MWGRLLEILLGLWLLLSPLTFEHDPSDDALWSNDLLCGTVVILLALLSFWPWRVFGVIRHAHLALLGVGGWLAIFGYIAGGHPAAPGYQNDILVGLTLPILAIIPNHASLPPPSWRHYFVQRVGTRRD